MPGPVFLRLVQPVSRAQAPEAAAEAEAAGPDRCPSPESPNHPGMSASPEEAEAEAEAEAAEVEVEVEERRSCKSRSPRGCESATDHPDRSWSDRLHLFRRTLGS